MLGGTEETHGSSRIGIVSADISTKHLLNTSQKYYCFSKLAEYIMFTVTVVSEYIKNMIVMFYMDVNLTTPSKFLLEDNVPKRMFGVSRDVIMKEQRTLLYNLYF